MAPVVMADSTSLPIIAIGASAGGLEPLEQFFESTAADTGWAFVVIQHLSPDFRSMMDEILARRSAMPVRHAEHGMVLAPDTIHLNPANSLMMLVEGRVALRPFEQARLPNLPIDCFFQSLVGRTSGPNVGVVMSGSGADGARGAAALRRAGGFILAQTPTSAKFPSMPKAAIAMGAADRILEPSKLMEGIQALLNGAERGGTAAAVRASLPKEPLSAIMAMIESSHGIDFEAYKPATVLRRIERRMELEGHDTIQAYQAALQDNPTALDDLYHDLLIGVTEFYRDPEAFAALDRLALGKLIEHAAPGRDVRLWVPGCASGEEAFSLAIAMAEASRAAGAAPEFRILATDVHKPAIDHAVLGTYTVKSLSRLPEELKSRYFRRDGDLFVIEPNLRRRVIFSVHNVLRDPPFTRLDLVSCRNLMIYLDETSQQKLLSRFLFGLRKDAYLFLGSSETVGAMQRDFVAVDTLWRIYQKRSERRYTDRSSITDHLPISQAASALSQAKPARPPTSLINAAYASKADRDYLVKGYDALLKRYAPASILIDIEGRVLTWFGAASDYIDTVSDLAERTIEDMVHDNLHYVINVGLERIRRDRDERHDRVVTVTMADGEQRRVAIGVEALSSRARSVRYVLVTIDNPDAPRHRPSTAPPAEAADAGDRADARTDQAVLAKRVRELERDLRLTEESLQYVTERLESSSEELQAANEELQASNEELQSANEELHSVNEELLTVSGEHQRKIEQLTELNADFELLLDALNIGTLILDPELRLRRFAHRIGEFFELMPHDIGRPISNLNLRLPFADPVEVAGRALRSAAPAEARGLVDGRSALLKALPYRTADRVVTGVVLILLFPEDLDALLAAA